jgi:hypothetical protein
MSHPRLNIHLDRFLPCYVFSSKLDTICQVAPKARKSMGVMGLLMSEVVVYVDGRSN